MKSEVLILGGGLSAYAAAWEAVLAGAKVDLFSDGAGASPFIHGICVPIGEDDSPGLYEKDTILAGCKQNDPELVHVYSEESAKIPEYLSDLGLSPDEENGHPRLLKPLGSSSARVLSVENSTGPTIMRELKRRLIASGKFTAHSGYRAVELLTKDGRVVGAKIYDRNNDSFFFCAAFVTILATGGFCRLYPETTTPPDLGGDGIAMASQAGAKLCDMEFIQFEPCSAVAPQPLVGKSIITTLFYEGAVLRNKLGERFLLRYGPEGERLQKDVLSLRMAREILSGNGGPCGGLFFDCTNVPLDRMRGVYAPYRNRYLAVGIDLEKTPVEVAPAAHTSLGGIKVDINCRTGIPGLIACGEVTGGLHGANRLGGNAGTETIVFGRIAGRSAAQDCNAVANTDFTDVTKNQPSALDVPMQREKLGMLLQNGLGVIRAEGKMRKSLYEVEEMLSQPLSSNSFEEIRLKNDLITARFALTAALENKKSIGCHYREDATKAN